MQGQKHLKLLEWGGGGGVSGGQDVQYSEFYMPVRTKILKQLLDYILIDWLYLRRY